jgi:hypothetical protein
MANSGLTIVRWVAHNGGRRDGRSVKREGGPVDGATADGEEVSRRKQGEGMSEGSQGDRETFVRRFRASLELAVEYEDIVRLYPCSAE